MTGGHFSTRLMRVMPGNRACRTFLLASARKEFGAEESKREISDTKKAEAEQFYSLKGENFLTLREEYFLERC